VADKLDYKKKYKQFYGGKVGQPVFVKVPKLNYLMIDGHGDPNTSKEYLQAIQTLYPVAYKLKFMSKLENNKDYGVLPLEGLWWAEDMSSFGSGTKNNWLWTAMIMQPEIITRAMFDRAVEEVAAKKQSLALDKLRLEELEEGTAVQVLYVGPYADEAETIQKLHEMIEENDGSFNGHKQKHHEIYLSDPRRTAPAKLKTIIRQPYTTK